MSVNKLKMLKPTIDELIEQVDTLIAENVKIKQEITKAITQNKFLDTKISRLQSDNMQTQQEIRRLTASLQRR